MAISTRRLASLDSIDSLLWQSMNQRNQLEQQTLKNQEMRFHTFPTGISSTNRPKTRRLLWAPDPSLANLDGTSDPSYSSRACRVSTRHGLSEAASILFEDRSYSNLRYSSYSSCSVQELGTQRCEGYAMPAVRKRKLVGLTQRDVRERKEKRYAQTEPTPRPT